MMKRRWIAVGLAAAVTVLSCGCGEKTAVEHTQQQKEPLVIWTYFETAAQQEGMDTLISGFNLHQDTYTASWEYVPMTEFTKKLSMAYTERALPDLAVIDNPDMAACIRMGMFEDITEFLDAMVIKENYYPALLQSVTNEGRMYGLPFDCNNVALIYNKQMLEAAGIEPPKTWDELYDAAALLTEGSRSGFLMSAVEGEQGAFQILPWILSAGEDKNTIGGERTVEALTFINRLVEDGYMTSNCINLSQTDVARVFIQGEAAMMENGSWVFPMLESAGIEYGVSQLPINQKSSVIVGGENIGVLKGKNVEGAKAFLEYYNQDMVMSRFCKGTGVLPTKMAIDVSGQPNMEVFQKQMEGAMVRSSIPSWNTLSKQLSKALYEMVSREKTPEEAAAILRVSD